MRLILTIRVLPGMPVQQFDIPLDLTGPATLTILPGEVGSGYQIRIVAEDGDWRGWYAHEIVGLRFE